MDAIKFLAETPETVTISRADLDALIDAAENAADIASVRAWQAYVAAVGRNAAIANSYTAAEAKRRLAGESPVRIWREKRGMTQRALAAAAGIPAGYLSGNDRGASHPIGLVRPVGAV